MIVNSKINSNTIFEGNKKNIYIGKNVYIGNNVKIFPNTKIEDNCFIGDNSVIGNNKINKIKIFSRLKNKILYNKTVISKNSIIRSNSVIYNKVFIGENFISGHNILIRENTHIGKNVVFGSYASSDGYNTIGSFTHIGQYVMLAQNNEIGKYCFVGGHSHFSNNPYIIQDARYDYFGSKIKNYVRIGLNCTILSGITIETNAFIGAKSLINIDIPKNFLAYGSPIKKIRKLTKKEIIDYKKSTNS